MTQHLSLSLPTLPHWRWNMRILTKSQQFQRYGDAGLHLCTLQGAWHYPTSRWPGKTVTLEKRWRWTHITHLKAGRAWLGTLGHQIASFWLLNRKASFFVPFGVVGRRLTPPSFSLPFSALPTGGGLQASLHKTRSLYSCQLFFPFPTKTASSEDNEYLAQVNVFPHLEHIYS